MLAETRIKAEQQEVEELDRRLVWLEDELKKALVADDENGVAKLDSDIATLKRKREHHQLRIDTLFAQQALEQRAAAAKQKAQLIGRVEVEKEELRKVVARFAKHLAETIKDWREWQDRAMKLAVSWPWPISDRIAAGFDLDEITRDVRHEICRVGSGMLLHAGAIQRPSFPGGLNPKLDWLHDPGRIPELVDTIKLRHAVAEKVLRAAQPVIEPERKAS